MSQPLSIGRVVHYRLPLNEGYEPTWRPALVVNEFDGKYGNLKVELDPANDMRPEKGLADNLKKFGCPELLGTSRDGPTHFYAYSAREGTAPGDWRWPPMVKPAAEPKKAEKAEKKKEPEQIGSKVEEVPAGDEKAAK